MRHLKKVNHLSRKTAHRKAMLANMACSLIKHKGIITTVAKAKALRKYVEPLLTRAKIDNTHSRRIVFSYLQNKEAVTELFREVAVKIANRPGGYTRILKLGLRKGDNADMCRIELVDYNTLMLENKKEVKKTKTSRRGRPKKKVSSDSATVAAKADKNAVSNAEITQTPEQTEETQINSTQLKENDLKEDKSEEQNNIN
ncbi:MAG TPA: 50S ribosomal protein L17 [Bacteroidales bacterium]|nr:50S ribosomal protein L17 [Bacteroidales bacterium]